MKTQFNFLNGLGNRSIVQDFVPVYPISTFVLLIGLCLFTLAFIPNTSEKDEINNQIERMMEECDLAFLPSQSKMEVNGLFYIDSESKIVLEKVRPDLRSVKQLMDKHLNHQKLSRVNNMRGQHVNFRIVLHRKN